MAFKNFSFTEQGMVQAILPSGNIAFTNLYPQTKTREISPNPRSTTPVNGKYVHPTDYSGLFFAGSGNEFDFRYQSGINRNRAIGLAPASLCSTLLLPTYGCDAATGYPSIPLESMSRAASSLRSQMMAQNWDIGTDIGEMESTLKFLGDSVTAITRLLRSLSRLDAKGVVTALLAIQATGAVKLKPRELTRDFQSKKFLRRNKRKGLQGLFLAYQFAWLPLLSSVHSALQLLEDGVNRPQIFKISTHVKDTIPEPVPRPGTTFIHKSWHAERGVKMQMTFGISSPSLFDVTLLGLTNPLSVAWELVPLSFVVDWFFAVGNFVKAFTGPIGLYFSEGFSTRYLKWSYHGRFLPFGMKAYISGSTPDYWAHLFSFKRDVLAGIPMPTPYFRGFGNQLSFGQKLSGLALALQFST